MIPQIIHYCWFGKGPIPQSHKKNIRNWKKKLPDFKFQLWNEKNFDVNICSYSREAYKAKKYAYVSDVARCYFLTQQGGIYLDTDVELIGDFNEYLNYHLFTAIETYKEFHQYSESYLDERYHLKNPASFVPYFGLLSSVLGTVRDNALLRDCLDYYLTWELPASGFKGFAIDGLLANKAVKYGFQYRDVRQVLTGNMLILETGIFGYADAVNPNFEVLFHHNAGSWAELSGSKKRMVCLDKYGLLPFYLKIKSFKKKVLSS
ncbi:MAG: hypothetical protein BGP01_04365 [Paludibacter sp. 47-17]|jgi:hypothetical protein|nr:MAG: hypothetical protein BGP01_04365 [Paludibacter sp. 47-17]